MKKLISYKIYIYKYIFKIIINNLIICQIFSVINTDFFLISFSLIFAFLKIYFSTKFIFYLFSIN
jgi:hypothetical protein